MVLAIALALIFACQSADAREDVVPGSRYTSARAAAMGDAFLPYGDDGASGLFYNPAVLSRLKGDLHFEPVNLALYGNYYYLDQFSLKGFNSYNVLSLSKYLKTLQTYPGQYASVGGSLMPSFSMRGFSFGLLMQSHIGAVANADGSVSYRSNYQMVPTLGFGVRLAGGIVRMGYSLQWVNQASGALTVPSDTSPLGYNESLAKGSALSHNVGFALTLPYQYLPAFNFVARNLLTAKFQSFAVFGMASNPSGVPADEPTTYDASISMNYKLGGGSRMDLVYEQRDLTNRSGVSFFGRMALGTEINIKNSFFLRGGWGSGYPSAGFGIRRDTGEFSFTWYSEELGLAYHQQRDIRYLMQYQVRAF